MNIIVALGNPGEKYTLTPHNIGWLVVEALAETLNIPWQTQKKFSSQTAFCKKRALFLIKPLTYMNLSGLAVKSLLNYYKWDLSRLLVIHDDIDLPFLSFRFHKNRGPAGHNGIKSLHKELGSKDYARMRIGMRAFDELKDLSTSEPKAPSGETLETKPVSLKKREVLKPFSKKEQAELPTFLKKALSALLYFEREGFEKTANRYNQA